MILIGVLVCVCECVCVCEREREGGRERERVSFAANLSLYFIYYKMLTCQDETKQVKENIK